MTNRLIIEELERWIKLGDERFAHYGVQAVVMGGNDDPWSIERVLDAATWVQNGDARILRVGNHELLSLGWSNVTPWHTEREASEWKAREEALALGLRRKDGAGTLLAAGDRIPGLLGSVAALLAVDSGHEAALAAALGGLADAVAVTSVHDVEAAITLLKAQDAGRASLFVGGLTHLDAVWDV